MQQTPENPNGLLELLPENCDRQYQEIQQLKGKLSDRTDVEVLGRPSGCPLWQKQGIFPYLTEDSYRNSGRNKPEIFMTNNMEPTAENIMGISGEGW